VNDLRESIIQILLSHQGRSKAIKGIELARLLNCDYRQVRQIIRDLIKEGYPIASAVQTPQGYFVIESQGEAWEYQHILRGRLIEDAKRLRDFKKGAGRKLDMVIQGKLI